MKRPPVRRAQEARQQAQRARQALARHTANLERARAKGDADAVAKAEEVLSRSKARLRSAEVKASRKGQIARVVGDMSRLALKVGAKAKAAGERWAKERDNVAKPALAAETRDRQETTVDSPYGLEHGKDTVERVLHPIEHRRRRGPSFDPRQKMAADRYRWAYEACPESMRCALDQSGRGGGGGSKSPTEGQLKAAGFLKEAQTLLGMIDGAVVRRVCGEGMTLADIAALSSDKSASARHHNTKILGERLRAGLTVLADHWWPEKRRVQAHRAKDAKPTGAAYGEFAPETFKGQVAHAADSGERGHGAPGRVFGFEPKKGQPDLRLKPIRKRKAKAR